MTKIGLKCFKIWESNQIGLNAYLVTLSFLGHCQNHRVERVGV